MLPDIRQNQYVREEKEPFNQAWNELLLKLLDMEFTEEMAKEANQAVITIIKALYMLGGVIKQIYFLGKLFRLRMIVSTQYIF